MEDKNMDYDQIERTAVNAVEEDSAEELYSEETEPKPKKVIKGKRKKRSIFERTMNVLLDTTGVKNVINTVTEDTIVPAIKGMVAEGIKSGVDMLIYGRYQDNFYSGNNSSRTQARTPSTRKTNYSGSYERKNGYARHRNMVEPVSFESNRDAVDVLKELDDIIRQYGFARVSDFYDITGYTEIQHNDNLFGWRSVRDCTVKHTRDGWVLYMSEPEDIDNIQYM